MNRTAGTIGVTRRAAALGIAAMLAGCAVVPKTTAPLPRADRPPAPLPGETVLPPSGETRHRVALLVPLSGENQAVGQSLANATAMALLDTDADNLRITTYDTAGNGGPAAAAERAVRDGNALILGPLLREHVGPVVEAARSRNVPVVSFSNDTGVAGSGAFIMGISPEQSVARSIRFARAQGAQTFAALIPEGDYGARAEAAFRQSVAAAGGRVAAVETFARQNTSIVSAARRVRAAGAVDAVFIADSAALAARAAPELGAGVRIIGNELWAGDNNLARNSALRNAIFASVPDNNFARFAESYRARFGSAPFRIATLGYDAVLLTLNVAQDWRVGTPFPVRALVDDGGFLGLDGPFRFTRQGVGERGMEVRQVRANGVTVLDPTPANFRQ
ncbi:penicillin-binding protein activator [Porphyrobacter sp. GA68]|uniref:penicillin-binding protein activator n=1 Tax=Porphyrobacter sp. GA68 TaxID=2883480 RepID=UPI001D18C806|nr:penicillin-binding protein activator [Porphyrobacter sp. GA68]